MTPKKIFVTGARGTIGRALVHELRARGHIVGGCDITHTDDPLVTRADVGNYRELADALSDFSAGNYIDHVYHLAGEFGRLNGEGWYDKVWTTNAVGTRNVMELCNRFQSHLIFASSSEIYGELALPLTEDITERKPIFPLNEYALSKWANETQIRNYGRKTGMKYTILRFFNAYGNEIYTPYRSVCSIFCHKALQGEKIPVYKGYHRVFMHMRDFIPTLAQVCDSVRTYDTYNIGGTDYRSVEELAQIVIENVGRGEVDLIPEDKHNVRSKRPVNWRANTDFGHNPLIKLEEGIPMYLDWLANKAPARV